MRWGIAVVSFMAASALFFMLRSGMLFEFWPTNLQDEPLNLTDTRIGAATQLISIEKFHVQSSPDNRGAISEEVRLTVEADLNRLLNDLLDAAQTRKTKSAVLGVLKEHLDKMKHYEEEKKDMIVAYVSESLGYLGIHSSNNLLNVWRYGVPLF